MAVSQPKCNAYVQDLLNELSKAIKDSYNAREKRRRGVRALVALQNKFLPQGEERKLSPAAKNELRKACLGTIDICEIEESHLRRSLKVIQNIRLKTNERSALQPRGARGDTVRKSALMLHLKSLSLQLPLFVPTNMEAAPPLCGAVPAVPNFEAPPQSMVAANVKNAKLDGWILARVRHYDKHSHKYEVDDVDDEQADSFLIHRKNIVPLPTMRAEPNINPDAFFQKGTVVSAIYPQTTCFYKAIVDELPSNSQDGYRVQFEDETYSGGYSLPLEVAQMYVIEWKG